MLKVSGLLAFCGLLASSSALLVSSSLGISLLDNVVNTVLSKTDLFGALKNLDLSGSLKNEVLNSLSLLRNINRDIAESFLQATVKIENCQALAISVDMAPNQQGVDLKIPLQCTIKIGLPNIGFLTLNVKTSVAVQLALTKDSTGKDTVNFRTCAIVSGSTQIQSTLPIILQPVATIIEQIMKAILQDKLLGELCSSLNVFLSTEQELLKMITNVVLKKPIFPV